MVVAVIVGYRRISTEAQGEEGLSMQHQTEAVNAWAKSKGAEEVLWFSDKGSGKNLQRDGLQRALWEMTTRRAAGMPATLVVSRLDRLSRSVADFAMLLDRAAKEGWSLVCLDPSIDMTTPYGKAIAQMAAVFAQLERELISQRTREGLAIARARGSQIGRESQFTDKEKQYIATCGKNATVLGREFGGVNPATIRAVKKRWLAQQS